MNRACAALVAALAVFTTPSAGGQSPPDSAASRARSANMRALFVAIDQPRLDRLAAWLEAVEQHVPGTDDAAARQIAGWSHTDLQLVRLDLSPILQLMRRPDTTAFFYEELVRSGVAPTPVLYGRVTLEVLRVLAAGAVRHGDGNRVLKRGAMLHTDLALLVSEDDAAPADPRAPALMLQFTDGRQLGLKDSAGHWEMARALLDRVAPDRERPGEPDPGRDAMVRRWYEATAAIMLATSQFYVEHLARTVALFPEDAGILLLAGAFHEALAAPSVQQALEQARIPSTARFDVGSARDELRVAQTLLERAVQVDPSSTEARIHLGRIIGLRRRSQEAVEHLALAASTTGDRLLRYYAELFLGGELDAAGDREAATAAYQRASSLYPAAQSPRLALSELATRIGDHAAAASIIETLADRSDDRGPSDPWWSYHASAGRDGEALLTDLVASFLREEGR